MPAIVIETPRLILRPWRDDDFARYAALNADPDVRRYWPSTLSRQESDAEATRLRRHVDTQGFGFWAVEAPGVAPFIGFIGLKHAPSDLLFSPAVEAGWRLARAYWGQGYATEGARAALTHGFATLGLEEMVAYAVAANAPSGRVMERIGITRDPADDFDDQRHEPGDPHRRHVVYRKRNNKR
jgi:RimJ/RimL family protein N-acetyltransferase